MNIRKISVANVDVCELPMLFDQEKIGFEPIVSINWADYPYRPRVEFRMAHTSNAVLLHFKIQENSVRAKYSKDNDPVWRDSCVEFFSLPADDGVYYNLACNCIGTLFIGSGLTQDDRQQAPQEVLDEIQRWSSLGCEPFDERVGETTWEVALIIPYSAFFKHQIASLDGKTIPANFYKCGDELQTPHFVSWNPIEVESPDFHCPNFFGALAFE